jgi:hypothetical protein
MSRLCKNAVGLLLRQGKGRHVTGLYALLRGCWLFRKIISSGNFIWFRGVKKNWLTPTWLIDLEQSSFHSTSSIRGDLLGI